MKNPPTIEELEKILASGEKPDIAILPDGSIRAVKAGTAKSSKVKVITIKQALSTSY